MYVMSYFRTEAEGLHLAISDDGLEWRALNGNAPILRGTIRSKTLRDPFITCARDGQFHLFATDGWSSDSIIHAVSADLLEWSQQEALPVMAGVTGTRNCWEPECLYDQEAQLYRVLWSSTVVAQLDDNASETAGDGRVWDHRIWATSTTDFKSYAPARLFFDPGYAVIDATIVYDGDAYLMAFKDERGENRFGTDWKAIRVCRSRGADGPWTEISELITPPLTEGPSLFRRAGGWTMVFDHFWEGFFGAMHSADGVRWTSITDQMRFPPGPRHASVFEVDPTIGQTLARRAG